MVSATRNGHDGQMDAEGFTLGPDFRFKIRNLRLERADYLAETPMYNVLKRIASKFDANVIITRYNVKS